MKIGIAVSKFNEEITSKMLEVAEEHAKKIGVEIVKVMKINGAYDLPLMVKHMLKKEDIDAVVTLGAVLKGETDHDQLIMESIGVKLIDLSLKFNKPVSLGIMGPDVNLDQAQKRIESYAKRAVEGVLQSYDEIQQD